MNESNMTEAEILLRNLAEALRKTYISSWQNTARWDKELEAAEQYLERLPK